MADAIFSEPRLAEVYDPLDPDRSDLDVYAAIVDELGAHSVLYVGCGTGTFACLLARRGIHAALRPRGHLVFETRDPARQIWREWNRAHSYRRVDIPRRGSGIARRHPLRPA